MHKLQQTGAVVFFCNSY